MQTILFTLRRKAQKPVLSLVLAAMAVTSGPVSSEAFFWDTDSSTVGNDANGSGLGGSGTWDTATGQWWDLSSLIAWPNSGTDQAIFTYAYPGLGIPVQNTVTVDAGGVNAGRISFLRSGYTLSGGAITLAGSTPTLHATLGDSATISSNLLGTAGLTKNGGGSIRLSGDNSGLTGPLSIANGTLIISNPLALPGTGTVSILTNNTTPLNTNQIGFTGGSLVLDGIAGGFTFSRDVNLEGRGPIGDRGSAILSLGDNTLSGTIATAVSPLPLSPTATFRNSRINSVNGILTLSGTLNAGGTAGTVSAGTFTNLGGVNSAGVGAYALTGVLAGTGSIEKSGAGTLFLNPSSTSGFSGTVRVSGSSIGQQSSVRVTQATVGGTSIFGANTAGNASGAIDMNGGVLEFRNEGNMDFNALASGKNVYLRANSTFFTGPAAGGSAINGLTTLGTFRVAANTTATFNSRNGYGMTLGAWTQESANNNTGIANAMGGTLTFTGDAWNNADASARNLTFSGDGNTRLVGSITATGTNKQLVKQGAGELIINGVASTFTGNTSVQGGTVRITDFRSLFNGATPGTISLGNAGTTAGNLIIGGTGAGTGTIAGLTTSKPILFNSTTGQSAIYANQSGANPVILNGAITSITTTGNYNFGGSNTADNIINTALPLAGAASGLTKVGSGTWVLNAANLYTGATNIQNGTLKLRATGTASNVIGEVAGNTIVFSVQTTAQTAGGTLEFQGSAAGITTETLGALTATAGAGTVRLLGQGGFASNLTFTSLGATTAASSLNFDTTGANGGVVTITGQTATTATGLPGSGGFQGHFYINGANFATTTAGGVVEAPTYGGAGNFRDAGPALVAATHNRLTAATASGALTISSLLTNSQTLTLSGNLVVSTGGILQSGGTATIQSDSGTARLIQGGTAGTNVAIRVDGSGDVLNLGASGAPVNISSTTTGGLTKNGAGTLVINGINAQIGATTINEGTIKLGDFNTPRVSAANAAMVIRQGAFFDLNGQSSGVAIGAFDGAGTVTNSSATAATLIVGNGTTGAGTFAGIIQDGTGIVNVTKAGTTGGPTWSGLNTYTGVTTIGGTTGLVTVDHMANGGLASGIGASSNAASNLVFSGISSGLVYRGSIIDTALTLGSRSATTDRLFTLSGSGATLSSTVTNNNAIVWSNTGAIVHGVTGPQSLVFTGTSTGDNTFNPQLTDSGTVADITSVTKTAAGQWNLGNSNNTYTGTTSVQNGILALNDGGALPANSPVVLGATTTSGIIQMSGTFARNLSTTPTAGTGTVTWGGVTGGGGFAAHATPLTVTLNGGAGLTWGSGGFVGTGGTQSLIFNSGSALADVTFTNGIDLGAAARTVTVNDNGNTGADYATMSGNLSGAGGSLIKAGAGVLRLTGANSYTGNTTLTGGSLVVSSLGSSAGGSTSGAGAGGVTMNDANAIILGNGGAQATNLVYVGVGETSDRKIRLNATGTNHANAIYADGSGPLILSNVSNDMVAGAKTLSLRGSNAAGNMITSQLSNNGVDALSVTVDGGATWILTNSANNYSGNTTAGAGALGIGDNLALGTGTLVFNNGNVFAYGADRTIANAITHNNNINAGFLGDYSLTFSSALNLAAGANNAHTTTNNIVAGKTLTFAGGVTANSLSANRAWAIDGAGETVINGDFTTSTAFGVRFDINGGGTLTLGTNGATSNFNQSITAVDVDRGILKFTANNAIPTTFSAAVAPTTAGTGIGVTTYTVGSTAGLVAGQIFSGTNVPAGSRIVSIDSATTFTTNLAPTVAVASGASLTFTGSGGVTLTPELATSDTARIDLNGTTQTITEFTATTDGTVIIDNTSASAATFRFGANNSTVNFGTGAGTYTVQNTGAGALSLVKLGNTTTTFGTGITLGHAGITASEGGGVFNIASPLTATTGLRATGASTLSLTGGLTNPSLITSIEVGGGSTLSLLDGAGSVFNNLTNLNLGAGSGTATLNLNVGDSATDSLTLLTGGVLSLANSVTFNLTDAGLSANTTYTLLNLIDGGITAFGTSNMIQGATPGGFDSFTWNVNNNVVQLTTGNLLLNDLYWRGSTNTNWNGALDNWSTDKVGAVAASSIPGQGNKVIFAYDGVGSGALTTELGQNFKINSLVFEAGTTTPASVTINPGTLTPNARLEIAPSVSSNGIAISTGGPAAVNIASALKLGADQTWNITDAATVLTLSGPFSGEADVVKNGSGRVVISGVADPTFNTGQTSVFTVDAGTLELTNSAALGTTLNTNVAGIVVNGGAYYYNNTTAGTAATLPHAMTLNGGVLSAGGNSHIYGGPVAITGNSGINMADSNGPAANTARNITLSGVVSGTGSLTIDSNNTVSAGNQLGGTLTMNNAANTWSGDLIFNEGTVTLTNAVSPSFTTNDVTFNAFGRLNLQGLNAATLTRSGTLSYGAGAIGELGVDNTSGALGANFLVEQNGAISFGSGGTGASVRIFLADVASAIDMGGPVTLGGTTSISVAGGDADSFATISGIIGDGGSGYGLFVNDDAGGWAQTNTILRLTGANTFTGNVTIDSGVLEFDTVTNSGGAASSLGRGTAINMGASTLRFVGSTSQSTNRPIATTGSATLSANGTSGAVITYNGAITQVANNTLTLAGTGEGVITGGITQPAGAATADLTVAGGTWTIQDNNVSIADDLFVNAGTLTLKDMVFTLNDDVVVTGGTAVLNLNTTGVLIATSIAGTSSGLHARTGGVINLNANDIFGAANSGGLDFINVGDSGPGAAGVFNTNGFNITSPGLLAGGVADGLQGNVTGSGTITVTSTATDHSLGIRTYRGAISANLAGVASLLKQGLGTMTLSGDNSGLTGTVAATRLDAGSLVLDFTTQNNNKISAVAQLDMRGANLTLNGNNSAASAQTVSSFTLGNGGANSIILNKGSGGNDVVLNLGAITRAVNSQDGTLRIVLPSGVQSATNGVTTSTAVTGGILGTAAFATVEDGTGTWFATKSGNNIVALASTPKNDVSTWLAGDHITDETSGFTGTYASVGINSLRFDAAGGSDINLGITGVLGIATGGILVTDNVGGTPSITGGTLFSGAAAATPELIVTHDSASTFEIGSDIRVNTILIKAGTGTLLLSGNNTTTGLVEIQNGTLQLRGGNAVGDNSVVTLSDDKVTTLELLDDETMGRLGGGSTTDGLRNLATVNVGGFTLTTNTTGGNTTYSGKFIGTGTIVKNGFGTNTNWNLNNISDGFSGTVLVNGGLFQLSNIGRIDATAIVFNKNGSLLLDNNSTTSSGARILDTASITLNSADGASSGETRPSGIWIRRDQGSAQNETVGVLSINSGASYTRLEGTATNAVSTIIADNIIRANSSTLNVRGTNMTATTGQRGQLRIGTAGNQTTFMSANMVGGGGALGTKTISIIPWAIAEETAAAVGDANMGNSLASYVSGVGFRALNLTTEYDTYAAAGAQSNTRESLAADLTGLNGKTINSLVLHNSSIAPATTYSVTGSGAGQTLELTSGALLFTLNPAAAAGAYGINLGGFDSGITVGGTNEFVFHVVNPSSAIASVLTATISSNLTSTADITKSGRGSLILTGTNTAGGGSRKTTINEGVLEIADLDNIGGGTGGLVFAGGTLRLSGAYTGDDLSSRTISFLQAGGTLDTNGVDLALANSLGSGVGGFTKTGAGNLTLNGAATYTGNSVLALGTVTVGANNALGNGGNLSLAAGTTLALGTSSLTHGLVSTAGAGTLITGTGSISASTGFFFSNTDATQIDAILAGAGGLFKNQTNTLTLAGLNTYTGTTEIQAGTLSFDSISNVSGGASALGNAANAENGIIRMGLTTAATTLTYTGSGHASDRLIGMQGTTGGVTLNGNGTGSIGFGGARFEMAGNKTLTLRGTSDPALTNSIGALTEIGGVLTLLKTDSNTWNLSQTNSYTGATSIDNGILRLSAVQNLTGALNFGSANSITTAGRLEVNENATFGTMVVQTNSAVNTNQLSIAADKTLQINGNTTIGSGVGALSTTLFNASGAGTFAITNLAAAAQFRVGGSATNGNVTEADFSGLAEMVVSLNTTDGIIRVNSTTGTNVNNTFSVLELAQDSTMTAATLAVGDGGQYNGSAGQINRLLLGTGSTILNVNTINVGTGARDLGSITFQDTTGTLTVRAADGVGATAFNMGTGTSVTAAGLPVGNLNTFDVTGHNSDILFGAVNIGTQNARTGAMENLFAFDTGTLATGNLTMGSKTAAGNSTNVMNLGGGTVTIGSGTGTAATLASNTSTGAVSSTINVTAGTVTIGSGSGQALILANGNTNAAGSSTGVLNISGGAVTLATTGTTAVTLANASAGTSTGSISVTGGSLTAQGAILSGTGAGTRNASVTLDGGLLDMSGNAIGASGNPVVLNARSGTLRNLGELNGGGTLDKTTAGTLILDTSNSHTGATTVSAGVLQVSHGGALGGTAAGTTVADGAVLELSGNITTANEALTLNGSGISDGGALRNTSGNNTYAGNITLNSATRINSDAGLLTLDATTGAAIVAVDQNLTLGGAGNITVADAITLGTGNLVKDGAGTVILSGDNSYTGTTTVSDGLLMINGDSSLATGAVTVASGATLGGSGTIGGISSTATIASGGTLTGGNDGSSGTVGVLDPLVTDAVGTLSFGGNLTASSGSIWLVDLVQGGTADLINVGGGLDITGSNLAINFGGAFVVDQVYTIASYGGGLTGTFAGLGEGAFVDPGNLYRINYGTGPSGAITLTAVPEPGTLGMLGLALGGFFVRRIRRRRAAAAALSQSGE